VFGCPSYVLDPRLQDGFKIPKWEPRARLGQFLGFSGSHSTTIGTIRNLRTGFVSPQYHVVYDETFMSVASKQVLDDDTYWNDLFLHHRDHYLEEINDPTLIPSLHDSWLTSEEIQHRDQNLALRPHTAPLHRHPLPPTLDPVPNSSIHPPLPIDTSITPRNLLDDLDGVNDHDTLPTVPESSPTPAPSLASPLSVPADRTTRTRRPNPRYFSDQWINIGSCSRNNYQVTIHSMSSTGSYLSKIDWDNISEPISERCTNLLHRHDPHTDEVNHGEMGYFTHLNSLDSPTLTDILTMEDKVEQSQWFAAMDDEVNALLSKTTFRRVKLEIATH
jgi:hypothetical protein